MLLMTLWLWTESNLNMVKETWSSCQIPLQSLALLWDLPIAKTTKTQTLLIQSLHLVLLLDLSSPFASGNFHPARTLCSDSLLFLVYGICSFAVVFYNLKSGFSVTLVASRVMVCYITELKKLLFLCRNFRTSNISSHAFFFVLFSS